MADNTEKSSTSKGSGEWTSALYSTAGIVILLALTIGVNLITGNSPIRVDMTEDKIFTLSEGSRNILKSLDTPVTIRFYATKNQDNMPPILRSYARRIEDVLSEYDKIGGKNIKIEKYDPEPLSDAEDKAKLDGIEPQNIDLFDQIYFGMSVRMLDKTTSIPALSLERESLLEYDISRMITQVANPKKAKIGLISGLPVLGGAMNPMMMQMGQQPQRPWIVFNQIRELFELEDLTTTVEEIPEDIDVLLVIHPKNLTDGTIYAIDQYLMGGGKLIVMADPAAIRDQSAANAQNQMQAMMQNGSNLDKLFSTWGLKFSTQVVADRRYAAQIGNRQQPQEHPGVLQLDKTAVVGEDTLTAQIDQLVMVFAGAFTGEPVEGLKKQDLIASSTDQSQLVESFMAQMGPANIVNEFKADDKKYALVTKLTGKFPTSFPDGKPSAEETSEDEGSSTPDENAADNGSAHLSESTGNPSVILVGDVDFIHDQFAYSVMNFLGQVIAQPQNGNSNLFLSMVEQMGGDENLIAIRGRGSLSRPFTKFKELRLEAEKKVQARRDEIEKDLEEAQSKINSLQELKQDGQQRLVLSPEQQKTLQEFREKEVKARQDLKEIQKELNKDINAVQRNWQIVQIVLVPFIVALLGVVTAIYKRNRTAAK